MQPTTTIVVDKMADIFSGIIGVPQRCNLISVSAKEWQGKLIFLHKVHEGKAIADPTGLR